MGPDFVGTWLPDGLPWDPLGPWNGRGQRERKSGNPPWRSAEESPWEEEEEGLWAPSVERVRPPSGQRVEVPPGAQTPSVEWEPGFRLMERRDGTAEADGPGS